MKNNYTPKKIKAIFFLEIIVAILGIIVTISYFIYKHIDIIILNSNDLTDVPFAILLSVALIVISLCAKKIWMFLVGILIIIFSFATVTDSIKLQFSNTTIFSIYISIFLLVFFTYVIVFAFIIKKKKLLALENKKRKELLALENKKRKELLALENKKRKELLTLEIEQCLSACKHDNNLWDLMSHHFKVEKNIKLYENLLTSKDENNSFNAYKIQLSNQKQNNIKNAILRHYKTICESLETKRLNLSKDIYKECNSIKDSIEQYSEHFDKNNKTLSLMILEKIEMIINFIYKYLNVYDTNNEFNIDAMKGQVFERYCANLLLAFGFYNITVTSGSGDQGVDIIGHYNCLKYAIQCKRYSHKLGNTPVQEVAAGRNYYNCQKALVITNNYFTDGAVKLAKANNVELWDRNKLIQMICFTDNQWNHLLENLRIEF